MNAKRIFIGVVGSLAIGLILMLAPTTSATASIPATSSVSTTATADTAWATCEDRCEEEYRECLESGGNSQWCQEDYYECFISC